MRWSVFFYLSSKRNRKLKHLVPINQAIGEHTIINTMKVSVVGTSLKDSEKNVYESYCKKNNGQKAEENKDCKFRIYRQSHRLQRYKFP